MKVDLPNIDWKLSLLHHPSKNRCASLGVKILATEYCPAVTPAGFQLQVVRPVGRFAWGVDVPHLFDHRYTMNRAFPIPSPFNMACLLNIWVQDCHAKRSCQMRRPIGTFYLLA